MEHQFPAKRSVTNKAMFLRNMKQFIRMDECQWTDLVISMIDRWMLRNRQRDHQMVQRRGFVCFLNASRILEWKWTRNVHDDGFPGAFPNKSSYSPIIRLPGFTPPIFVEISSETACCIPTMLRTQGHRQSSLSSLLSSPDHMRPICCTWPPVMARDRFKGGSPRR